MTRKNLIITFLENPLMKCGKKIEQREEDEEIVLPYIAPITVTLYFSFFHAT